MNNWLTYLLEVSICHALFFLVYYVFLRNLSFFQINRIFLLVITVLGFIIPILDIPVNNNISTDKLTPIALNLQNLNFSDPVITNNEAAVSNINWLLIILSIIYFAGVSVRLCKLFNGISKVLKLINSNNITDYKGIKTIYLKEGNHSFFTFFNYMFISTSKGDISSDELRQIIKHEKVHLINNHTLDNLIMELSIILCWFNPIPYFLKREINHVHEFYADQVANENGNIEDYSRLILRLSSGENHQYLIHQFSMKNIKKRIIMLNKNKNQRGALLRYFSIVPSLILLLAIFACDYNESVPTERIVEEVNLPDNNAEIEEPPQILEPFNHLAEKYFGSNFLLSDILIKNLDGDIESGKLSWSSDEIRSLMIQLFKEKNVSESDLSSLNNFLDEWNITVISNGESKPSMVFEIPDYLRDNKRNIGSISWKGNTIYSDEYLAKYIGLKQGDFFNEETLNVKLNYNPDGNDLASLYMDKGYLFFSIDMKKINRDGNVDLVFEISEGDVFKVSKVKVTGNKKVKNDEILQMIGIKDGDIFKRSKLLESQKEIAESGLFNPKNVNPNLVPNPIEKTVEIEFQVSEL